jgi:iron complex transport system ATP-binding protein
LLEIKKLTAGYGEQEILHQVDLEFPKGEFCALLGPNGAGKTTLLKTIVGYLPYTSGDILIKKRSLQKWSKRELSRNVALISQEFSLQFDYTVEELVLMGRFPYLGYWQNYSDKDRQIVAEILAKLDLSNYASKLYSQLSGGEKKRVSIARALAQQTDIMLLDEAFTQLDINHQIEIMHILSQINKQDGKLILLISHNINLASEYCERIVLLKQGRVLADGKPAEIINQENLQRLYNARLQVIQNPVTKNPNLIYPELK